jgi:hypothetical protein
VLSVDRLGSIVMNTAGHVSVRVFVLIDMIDGSKSEYIAAYNVMLYTIGSISDAYNENSVELLLNRVDK